MVSCRFSLSRQPIDLMSISNDPQGFFGKKIMVGFHRMMRRRGRGCTFVPRPLQEFCPVQAVRIELGEGEGEVFSMGYTIFLQEL